MHPLDDVAHTHGIAADVLDLLKEAGVDPHHVVTAITSVAAPAVGALSAILRLVAAVRK